MLGLDLGGRFDQLVDLVAAIINRVTGATAVSPGAGVETATSSITPAPLASSPSVSSVGGESAILPNGLIVAIDDAQWLDTMSWSLIGLLARRCPRLFLVRTRSRG